MGRHEKDSSSKNYDEIEIYVRDNENTKVNKENKNNKKTKTKKATVKVKKKKNKKEKNTKNEKSKKESKHILRKILLTILLIIVIVAVVFFIYVQKNGGGIKGIVTTVVGSSADKIKELPDIYMLVMGKSENMTDTIMVVKYSSKNQSASMLSIPRDTFTGDDENKAKSADKINSKYINGGAQETLKEVNKLTGLNIKYYLTVDTKALRDLVDVIGGVEFDVPVDMNYDDVTQNLHIHVKKGLQTLNGEQAEGVVRFRHNNDYTSYPISYGDNDLGRMRTQREFLKILLKQLMQPGNVTKINNLMKIAQEEIETNINWDMAKDYIPSLFGFDTNNLKTNALPGEAKYCNGVAVFLPSKEKSKDLINTMFLEVVDNTKIDQTTNTTSEGESTNKTNTTPGKSINKTNTTKKDLNEIRKSLSEEGKRVLIPKSSITLQLINATGTKQRFEKAKSQLKNQGYKILTDKTTNPINTTILVNRSKLNQEDMGSLKSLLGVGNILSGDKNEKIDITIIIGKDY